MKEPQKKPTDHKPDIQFGTNSIEENEKLAKKLVETGFDIKAEEELPDLPPYPESRMISEDASEHTWKERYYMLLDLINTFKGNKC